MKHSGKRFFSLAAMSGGCLTALVAEPLVGLNNRQQVVLVFPSEIRYADFGSGEVSGRTCATSRAIALKTSGPSLPETTVSVVTADGKYYEYEVTYREHPDFLAYDMERGVIPADTLYLSTDKTTHFIASSKVADFVTGSDSTAAAYAESIENIVKAKQLYPVRLPGSLTVLTASEVHPYVIDPSARIRPSVRTDSLARDAIFREASVNDAQLKAKAEAVLGEPPFLSGVGTLSRRMEFSLTSVMTDADWVMLRLRVANRSDLDYETDFVKVYIEDRRSVRNMATQEDEITPSFVYYPEGEESRWIPGRGETEFVQFFPRFSLPEKRMLTIELFEKNGGRHLTFHVLPKELLKAKKLPHLTGKTK